MTRDLDLDAPRAEEPLDAATLDLAEETLDAATLDLAEKTLDAATLDLAEETLDFADPARLLAVFDAAAAGNRFLTRLFFTPGLGIPRFLPDSAEALPARSLRWDESELAALPTDAVLRRLTRREGAGGGNSADLDTETVRATSTSSSGSTKSAGWMVASAAQASR